MLRCDKRNSSAFLVGVRCNTLVVFFHSVLVRGWATRIGRSEESTRHEARGAAEAHGKATGVDVDSIAAS
jgi:hypothetical protein